MSYLLIWKPELPKQRVRQRDIYNFTPHMVTVVSYGSGWSKVPRPSSWLLIRVVVFPATLEPYSVTFPICWAGSWMAVQQTGLELTLIWDARIEGFQLYLLHYNVGPNIRIRKQTYVIMNNRLRFLVPFLPC